MCKRINERERGILLNMNCQIVQLHWAGPNAELKNELPRFTYSFFFCAQLNTYIRFDLFTCTIEDNL